MDRSAWWLTFVSRHTKSCVSLYSWPAASTLKVETASDIPLVRKHMISVLASETVIPNAAQFVVRRLQELGRKAGVPLFLCFIDIQKAYDSVDRNLLWQVLSRLGVLSHMIAVIREFYDGMKACVRSNDGTCSKPFEVNKG